MKNKNKYIAATLATVALLAPLFALAQFDPTAGGGTGLSDTSILTIVQAGMKWLLILVGMLAVIFFAIAGILYLTAAGDQTRIDSAKRAMTYSIVGVVVALLGLIILSAVGKFLGGQSQF